MSDTKRVRSDPKRGEFVMSAVESTAAREAFEILNVLTRQHYRGAGDTASAARDRAAKDVGITTAQAERVWKRWRNMSSIDGDVYRLLRNRYEGLCQSIEDKADAMRARRLGRTVNAVVQGAQEAGARNSAGRD